MQALCSVAQVRERWTTERHTLACMRLAPHVPMSAPLRRSSRVGWTRRSIRIVM